MLLPLLQNNLLTAGGQLYQVAASDGIYMLDPTRREEAHVRADPVLLGDQRYKELGRFVAEGLLMFDSLVRERSHQQRAAALLSDAMFRTVEVLRRDGMLVVDTAEVLKLLSAIERLVQDGLYLRDTKTSDRSSIHREGVYLGDTVQRDQVLTLYERLLLRDYVVRVGDLTLLDRVLIEESFTRSLELRGYDPLFLVDATVLDLDRLIVDLLAVDGVLLYDSVTVQTAERMLISAFLSYLNPLGIAMQSADVLGRSLAAASAFGMDWSYARPRVLQ